MSPKAIRPCPFAIATTTVPARRWATRADLLAQLSKARCHIETAPLDELSVEQAAVEAGLSIHHFIRLFHEVYSERPSDLIKARRIEEAQRMLRQNQLSILEIACEVGFQNASAFSRAFRRAIGMSPSQFRDRI